MNKIICGSFVANIITRYVKNSIKDLDRYLELKAFW